MRVTRLLLAGFFLICSVQGLWAQRTTATFSGIVTDPTGGVIPGAEVELTNENTGAVVTQVTSDIGEFIFNFVPVGVYTLGIVVPGFKTFENRQIPLGAAQNVRRKFALELGEVSQTITVSGEASLVNAVSPEQRANYEEIVVKSMPLPNRNFSKILELSAGLTRHSSSPGSGGGRVRLNGLGGSSVRITANGTDASGNAGAPGLSQYQQPNRIDTMSAESVGEVQVVKGVVAAEYGAAMAGNVNVITKSGTNAWHGSLFYRYEGAVLNARDQFLSDKANKIWNQYGGSLGGPIKEDRAFVFLAYEGYAERSPRVVNGDVPTERGREEILEALPFPETQLNLAAFPLPNQPTDPDDLIGEWSGARRQTLDDDHYDARFDLVLWDGNFSTVYARGHPSFVRPRVSEQNSREYNTRTDRLSLNYTKSIGDGSWTSDTRYGFNKNRMRRVDNFWNTIDPTKPETIPGQRRVAGISLPGMDNLGGAEAHIRGIRPTHSIEQQFAVVKGRHSLKFGGLWMRPAGGRPDFENPRVRFQSLEAMRANDPSEVRITFGVNEFKWSTINVGFFVQDDWRINPKLVLNLGLRYDWFGKFVAKPVDPANPAGLFNRDGLLDQNFNFGPLRDPNDPFENDALNLAPRFGFAYNPDGEGETVVRGGFGVMFQSLDPQMFETGTSNSPLVPFRRTFSRVEAAELGLSFPVYNEDVFPILEAQGVSQANDVVDPRIEAPYAMNFSLGIQRVLAPSLVLETGFVGTRGVKFVMTRIYNDENRLTGIRPNPNLGENRYHDNSQQTSYYSWQTSLRRRLAHNLAFDLNHTWGKALAYTGGDISRSFNGDTTTNVQEFFNVAPEYSPASGDITHLFIGNWIYQVPTLAFAQGSPLGRQVFGGWEISGIFKAQTGQPLNISQTSQLSASRPDLLDFDNAINESHRSDLQYLNPDAFSKLPVTDFGATIRRGNLGHHAFRGPGFQSLDLSLAKNFLLPEFAAEEGNLEFRADLLNAFNHTNYTSVRTNLRASRFGRITNTAGARTIQLQLRLSF